MRSARFRGAPTMCGVVPTGARSVLLKACGGTELSRDRSYSAVLLQQKGARGDDADRTDARSAFSPTWGRLDPPRNQQGR